LDENEKLMQEKEKTITKYSKEKLNVKLENESLQKKLIKQEQIKQELVTTHENQFKKLREDLKLKQKEIETISQKYDEMGKDLETKMKAERNKVLQEKQKSESLQDELQRLIACRHAKKQIIN